MTVDIQNTSRLLEQRENQMVLEKILWASNAFNFNFKVFSTGRGTERIQSRLWQWSNSTSLDRCKDAKINQHKQKVGPWLHDSSKGRGGWEERVTGAATLTKDYGRKSYFIQIFDMQYCQQVRIPISFVSPIGINIARIANAVQVTLWLSVNHLNRYLCNHCSHCSQCLLVSTSV